MVLVKWKGEWDRSRSLGVYRVCFHAFKTRFRMQISFITFSTQLNLSVNEICRHIHTRSSFLFFGATIEHKIHIVCVTQGHTCSVFTQLAALTICIVNCWHLQFRNPLATIASSNSTFKCHFNLSNYAPCCVLRSTIFISGINWRDRFQPGAKIHVEPISANNFI